MADNVILPGTGETVATEDISGTQFQQIKVVDAGSGSFTPLRVLDGKPLPDDAGAVVRQSPCDIWLVEFSEVGSALVSDGPLNPAAFTQRRLASGMTVSQTSSTLQVTTGIAASNEFLARSNTAWCGSLITRCRVALSQRLTTNNFSAMLADRIAESASCSVNAAGTVLTVTGLNHGFTVGNVGQSMFVGASIGFQGVPGRYAIASVPDNTQLTFTVSGFPASATGTVDLFGWNYIRVLYSGSSATSADADTQCNGWRNPPTTININTTNSPGHIMQFNTDGRNVYALDSSTVGATIPPWAARTSWWENIPDDTVPMYFYLWAYNGTTAPVSSTTWTIGFVSVENVANVPTYIAGIRPLGTQSLVTTQVAGTVAVSMATNTPILAAGSNFACDIGIQNRPNATGAASGVHLVSAASTNATIVKASGGRVVGWSLANTNAAWRYVKLHNITTLPTAGTGVVRTIAIPPNDVNTFSVVGGIGFSTGIGLTTVTGAADGDTTAVGLNDIVGDLFFA